MPDIDLEPHRYRPKGVQRVRDFSRRHNLFLWLGTLAGIWAGGMLFTMPESNWTGTAIGGLALTFGPALLVCAIYEILEIRKR